MKKNSVTIHLLSTPLEQQAVVGMRERETKRIRSARCTFSLMFKTSLVHLTWLYGQHRLNLLAGESEVLYNNFTSLHF